MKAVILSNIGTPKTPEPNDVGIYLKEFLMDPYVVDIPFLIRYILVNFIIVPKRKYDSSHAYKQIWTNQGSPLRSISEELAQKLNRLLGGDFLVRVGMRYSEPSLKNVLLELKEKNIQEICFVPLYPQFADSSTTSAIEKLKAELKKLEYKPNLKIIDEFFDHPDFIKLIANDIKPWLHSPANSKTHVLMSYHGLPERQLQRISGDCMRSTDCCERECEKFKNHESQKKCYRAQCFRTTQLLAQLLELKNNEYSLSFQSRLGRTKWIEPYTDVVLPQLVQQGVERLIVICPSFVTDCLETLEEINVRAREQFMSLGGKEFIFISCLNAKEGWVKLLRDLVVKDLI